MPESIGDAGLLATPGDAKSFASAVHRLADSPELRDDLVQRGRKRIAGFRWKECGVAFARLINERIPSGGFPREYRTGCLATNDS